MSALLLNCNHTSNLQKRNLQAKIIKASQDVNEEVHMLEQGFTTLFEQNDIANIWNSGHFCAV